MLDHTESWGDRKADTLHPHVYADNPAPRNRQDAVRQLRGLKATLRDIATEQRLRRAERVAQGVDPEKCPHYNEWYARSCKAYKASDRHRRALELWLDAEEDALALQGLDTPERVDPGHGELRYLLARVVDTLLRNSRGDHSAYVSELTAIRKLLSDRRTS